MGSKLHVNQRGQPMTRERKTTANMRLAQWGLTCKIEHSCFYSALVQVDSAVLLNPPLRQAPKRSRNLMRANEILLKTFFLLILSNSVYSQESKNSFEEEEDKIDSSDKDCLSEIARAKMDINQNKIVFTRIYHLIDMYPRKAEMDSLLNIHSISVVEGYGSCFHYPKKRKHCYKEEMEKK